MLDEELADALIAPPSRSFRLAGLFGVHDAGRLLRDFLTYFPAKVVTALASLVALPILARRLPPTELGTLALAQTLINLGWIVSMQWLTSTVLRELPMHRASGDIVAFRRGFLRAIGLVVFSFAAFAGLVAVGSTASDAIRSNELVIIAAAAGLSAQNLTTTMFLASLRPRAYGLVELAGRVGGIALGIRLVFSGHGVHGFLLGLAIVPAAVGVVFFPLAWPRGKRTAARGEPVSLRAWVSYGVPAAASASVMWGFLFVDRYLLAALKTTGDVGVYSLGAVVGSQAVLIPALALGAVARPLLYGAFESKGRETVERMAEAYTRVLLVLVLPVLAFVVVTASPVIHFLSTGFYGNYYTRAIDVAPIVALAGAIQSMGYFGNIGLAISRRSRLQIAGSGSALAVTVVANLVLIPFFGIMGTAVATVLGSIVLVVAPRRLANRYVTWHFPYATLARAGAAAALGAGAGLLARSLAGGDLARILLAAAIGGPVYAVALVLLKERLPPGLRAAPLERTRS